MRTQGILPTILPATTFPGPYVWEAFELTAHAVLTHRTPVGTYRGPGMTEAAFVRERMLDVLARRARARSRRAPPPQPHPRRADALRLRPRCRSPPIVYESGDFAGGFERLLAAAGYDALTPSATAAGTGESVGIGVAASVELGAIGPFEEATRRGRRRRARRRSGRGRLARPGRRDRRSRRSRLTSSASRSSRSRSGTTTPPTCASGFGSFASRTTVVAGNAVALRVPRASSRRARGRRASARPGGARRGVAARFEKPHPSYSFGASLVARVSSIPRPGVSGRSGMSSCTTWGARSTPRSSRGS